MFSGSLAAQYLIKMKLGNGPTKRRVSGSFAGLVTAHAIFSAQVSVSQWHAPEKRNETIK